MTYLLIAFVLLIIISPLMWFRQSPRQKLITDMRRDAASKGMSVKLSRPADAREGEGRLECVKYTLPWLAETEPSPIPRMEKWLLVRETRRGDPSPWPPWQWLGRESNEKLYPILGDVLEVLPTNVSALEARPDGLAAYWQERGELTDVQKIYQQLTSLRDTIRH
jgi:hypothetical protein